jgi:hypothetical protein
VMMMKGLRTGRKSGAKAFKLKGIWVEQDKVSIFKYPLSLCKLLRHPLVHLQAVSARFCLHDSFSF